MILEARALIAVYSGLRLPPNVQVVLHAFLCVMLPPVALDPCNQPPSRNPPQNQV